MEWLYVISALAILLALVFWLGIPAFLHLYYRQLRISKQLDNSGLPTHWFWGNVKHMMDFEKSFRRWTKRVQETRAKLERMWIGPFEMLVLLYHPDTVRKVLKEPKDMGLYRLIKPWIGDGLLVSSGQKWFRNRRLLTPAFHYEILKPYIQVSNNCVEIMLDQWQKSAEKKEPVKVFGSVSYLSLDILLQCAFSYKSDCQRTRDSGPYVKAMYKLLLLITQRSLSILYQYDCIYWLSPDGREMKRNCDLVHEHSQQVIQNRKKALGLEDEGAGIDRERALEIAKQNKKYLDFLDILLTAADEDGNGLTDLEIRDEADTFMFEGHDTTTSGISWTLYCLAKYPEHQEKIREEVRNVLMGREWLDYDDLKELKYTQWCIKEAMRLYPPVPEVFRKLSKDTELDGIVLPQGTSITIIKPALHRHPDIWENPEKYDPLRFHPSSADGRDPLAYIPFSAGHRNCIGQNFALNEERVVIATIINRFRISLVPGHHVGPQPLGVLKASDDILLNLETVLI